MFGGKKLKDLTEEDREVSKISKINSIAFYWLLHDLMFSSFLVSSNSRIFEILLLRLSPSTEVSNCCFFQVVRLVHQEFERAQAFLCISCTVSTSLRQGAWSPLWRSQNLGPDSGSVKLEWQNSLQKGTCQWNLSSSGDSIRTPASLIWNKINKALQGTSNHGAQKIACWGRSGWTAAACRGANCRCFSSEVVLIVGKFRTRFSI